MKRFFRYFRSLILSFFFFNDTATTEIYTLSLHDALPISPPIETEKGWLTIYHGVRNTASGSIRSEEHTSELQSQSNLVCRLLLEKKKESSLLLNKKWEEMVMQTQARSRLLRHPLHRLSST